MRAMSAFISVSALLATLSAGVQAEYYRWTDSNGVTHFTDQPTTAHSKAIDFREPTMIPMAGNNQSRGDRLQGLKPEKRRKGSSGKVAASSAGQNTDSDASQAAQQKNCQNYVERIDNVERRLRAGGYSANTGNRLRRERRELASKRAWECLRR